MEGEGESENNKREGAMRGREKTFRMKPSFSPIFPIPIPKINLTYTLFCIFFGFIFTLISFCSKVYYNCFNFISLETNENSLFGYLPLPCRAIYGSCVCIIYFVIFNVLF